MFARSISDPLSSNRRVTTENAKTIVETVRRYGERRTRIGFGAELAALRQDKLTSKVTFTIS